MSLLTTFRNDGIIVNHEKYVYSWHHELVLVRNEIFEYEGISEEMARMVEGQLFGTGRPEYYLEGYRVLYQWIGAANFRPLDRQKGVIMEKVLHACPGKWVVCQDGQRIVRYRADVEIVRKGQ